MRHLTLATLFFGLINGFFTLKVDFRSVSSAILLLTVLSETDVFDGQLELMDDED